MIIDGSTEPEDDGKAANYASAITEKIVVHQPINQVVIFCSAQEKPLIE